MAEVVAWALFITGILLWLVGMLAQFRAIANRRPDVSWVRASRWLIDVYGKEVFTGNGRHWLRISLRSFAGFAIAWILAFAIAMTNVQ